MVWKSAHINRPTRSAHFCHVHRFVCDNSVSDRSDNASQPKMGHHTEIEPSKKESVKRWKAFVLIYTVRQPFDDWLHQRASYFRYRFIYFFSSPQLLMPVDRKIIFKPNFYCPSFINPVCGNIGCGHYGERTKICCMVLAATTQKSHLWWLLVVLMCKCQNRIKLLNLSSAQFHYVSFHFIHSVDIFSCQILF